MRKVLIRLVVPAVVLFSLGLTEAPNAFAASTQCTGLLTGAVTGRVVVPSGEFCDIRGATVTGNVIVLPDASLRVDDSTIMGKIMGFRPDSILIFGSGEEPTTVGGPVVVSGANDAVVICGRVEISGNVVIRRGVEGGGVVIGPGFAGGEQAACLNRAMASITGPVVLWKNASRISVNDTSFGGDLSAVGNTGGGQIDDNVITGDLVCANNVPPLTAEVEVRNVAGFH